jgi:hypothetical protein
MKNIDDVLKEKLTGLHYRNRIIVPFTGYILKLIVDKEIITDFSVENGKVEIKEYPDFLEVYFTDFKDLKDAVSKYEAIKMIIVEKGKDVFDFSNHRKILLYLTENHKLLIEETDENILFIE